MRERERDKKEEKEKGTKKGKGGVRNERGKVGEGKMRS